MGSLEGASLPVMPMGGSDSELVWRKLAFLKKKSDETHENSNNVL